MNDLDTHRRPVLRQPASTNGDVLPEHRQKQVEAGLATYQSVLAERDSLDKQLGAAQKEIASLKTQLDAIQGIVNLLESTVQTYQLQRDDATIKVTRLETILENVSTLLITELHAAGKREQNADQS